MPLPIMTDKDDIDKFVDYLRKKPVGVTLDDAKATIDKTLLDHRKLAAYRTWGFLTDDGGKLKLTQRGHAYSRASEEEKQKIFSEVLAETKIYARTIEWLTNNRPESVSSLEIASHWHQHFRADVATESEKSLNYQVICFMGIAQAAGLGEYKIGRRGQPTRLEINLASLSRFNDTYLNPEHTAPDEVSSSEVSTVNETPNPTALLETPSSQLARGNNYPSLHIDIQIHIDPDATPEQIDKIFESMARHLYKIGND